MIQFDLQPEHILYEDETLVAINKPAGIPTQGTLDPKRDHLYASVQRYFKSYIGLHHRLDVGTSGVVLFSKSKSVNKSLTDMFREHAFQKTYVLVAVIKEADLTEAMKAKKPWQIRNHIKAVKDGGKTHMEVVTSGGDEAITDLLILNSKSIEITPVLAKKGFKPYRLLQVEAQPKTGRMHQIRVHAKFSKLRLLGDRIYGNPRLEKDLLPDSEYKRLMLHAWKLAFPHPLTNHPLIIEAPIPPEFISNFI